jgi:hypothetical protein
VRRLRRIHVVTSGVGNFHGLMSNGPAAVI